MLSRVAPGSPLRSVLADGLEPVFYGIQAVRTGVGEIVLGFFRGPFLLEENRRLRALVETARAHEETHRELAQENDRLRALLDFKRPSPWPLVPAEVIGHELRLWSRTLLLNKGTRQGVESGMAVVTPAGLVGRVAEAAGDTSRVILVTDPHFRAAALLSQGRVSGLAAGTASGECLLTYLPLDAPIQAGEPVLTGGGRSFCPGGIPIGTVVSVAPDPSKLFLSARLRPAVNGAGAEEVLVVRTSGE